MSKVQTVIRKTLKVFMWVILSLVLVLFLVALLIQIPSVQTRIVQTATSYVSDKTNTKVEIGNVSISFPKSVVLQGLFLEDLHRDTLLYAGKAKVNIALLDLLKNKITVSSFSLDDVSLHLHNSDTDSLFNYNFLLTAFADTTAQASPDTTVTTAWTFSLGELNLENIRLRYEDYFGGMIVKASLEKLELEMEELDLENSIYSIDDLVIENINASVMMKESSYASTPESASETPLPKLLVNTIEINNSRVSYSDSVNMQSVLAVIDRFKLTEGMVDLPSENISINRLTLSESDIQYLTFGPEQSPDSLMEDAMVTPANNWKVSVNRVMLDDNSLVYKVGTKQAMDKNFNADHLEYKKLTLYAKDLSYSTQQTKASVTEFMAIDQNGFEIKRFETDFSMDENTISATGTHLETPHSILNADFSIEYDSLAALTQSMQFNNLHLDLREARISNSDILYFNPDLTKQPYFAKVNAFTTVSGKLEGTMDQLTGQNIEVHAADQTVLETDLIIRGLQNFKTAWYHLPNAKLVSGREDIVKMAGTYLPENMEVPEKINLGLVFKGKMNNFESTMDMISSFGAANLTASLDPKDNFSTKVNISNFDVGSLMKDTLLYGPVSLTAQADGQGLDMATIKANIKAEVTEIYMNQYTYHNLAMDGSVNGKQFEGNIHLDDENAVLDFDGLVNMNPAQEQYKFKLNVQGLDMKKLNLSDNDVQLSFISSADMKGGTIDQMNGTAGITNLIVAHQGEKYRLDSLLSATVNEPDKSEISVSSALIDIDYAGTLSPIALPGLLNQFINGYFTFSDSIEPPKEGERSDFNFEIQVHNHPILSKVLLPELTEFEPGLISGSFDSEKKDLKLNAHMSRIVYGAIEIDDFVMDLNSDNTALNYKITTKSIGNTTVNLENFLLDGKLEENVLSANLSSIDGNDKKLVIRTELTKNNDIYKLILDPSQFFLVNNQWDVADDNSIEWGNEGFKIHHFFINHEQSEINIASVNDRFKDDLNIDIKNFRLENISRIIEKDTSLVKGNLDGNILMKRVEESYGIISDIKITNLVVQEVPIGNLTLKADNPTTKRFDIEMNLTGPDNNLTTTGYFIPSDSVNAINIQGDIQSLAMKTVEAFSMGQITEAAGTLTGNFLIAGKTNAPEITGELVFNNTFMKPAFLNNRLEIKDEKIELKKDGIYFDTFTLTDSEQHKAIINGSVKMKQFSDYTFALDVNTTDFLLFNTTVKDNENFFGRMVIDSKINVGGSMNLPVINARVKMKEGSNFTFAVPESTLTTDKGENVVEFLNPVELNPILNRSEKQTAQISGMSGFDLSSIIEIDEDATLRLLMDPASADSLVVRGEAALSFTIDQSGKMSLTGAYNLNQGSYLVSLESVIKRQFNINSGSTIIWNGDPLDAAININATYSVRASPSDLMYDQISDFSEVDQGGYKQRYPFLVQLQLGGEILRPEISFEIQLAPENRGILGGAVHQKLLMLNEDESALNKQVFALLVLGRFIQENPFETAGAGGTSTIIRSTVSKFLSAQLNQLGAKIVPGMELNFDIQSYDDYESGQAEGRTEVEIGVKQQLFNERLSLEIGGSVDVEGDKARQNSASDITGDVTVEYKLTEDGRFRLKGFRHNQYEGAIEGQLVETGVGIVYVRDFSRWSRLFKSEKKRRESMIKRNNNDTIEVE